MLAGGIDLVRRIGAIEPSQMFASRWVQLLVGTGFCGTLTTYSTFSYETLRLIEQNAKFVAVANVAASIVAGLGGAFLGVAIGQAIWT